MLKLLKHIAIVGVTFSIKHKFGRKLAEEPDLLLGL